MSPATKKKLIDKLCEYFDLIIKGATLIGLFVVVLRVTAAPYIEERISVNMKENNKWLESLYVKKIDKVQNALEATVAEIIDLKIQIVELKTELREIRRKWKRLYF